MQKKNSVIYRYCKVCRRAAKRFSVMWTEPDETDVPSQHDQLKADAILAAEYEETCDGCKALRAHG